MVNEDDDSTIRNLKLVPLPPLGDKDAMNEHLDDALSRAVRVGKILSTARAASGLRPRFASSANRACERC